MNYKNIYYNIINNRIKNKYEGYTESHHILPKSLGGSDEKTNLVDLSAREHYICHLLLTKMFDKDSPEYFKMIHAYMMMCNMKNKYQKRGYKINSRLYESLKNERQIFMKKHQNGENNSQYNTMWIHNKKLRKSKKIHDISKIENGWEIGRIVDFSFLDKCCEICNINLNLKDNISKRKICEICKEQQRLENIKGTKYKEKPSNKFKNGKKCYCDGKIYDNISIASYELNILHETLRKRIKNPNNEKYYYL